MSNRYPYGYPYPQSWGQGGCCPVTPPCPPFTPYVNYYAGLQCNQPCGPPPQWGCLPPCPPPPPPQVVYITTAPTPTAIPSGTVGVAPNPIPAGSTVIPAGTVTPVTGFTGVPSTNIGGVTVNTGNGQFTIPAGGRYFISAYISVTANANGSREIYIYKVDATTGIISLLTMDGRNAVLIGPTGISLSTGAELNANDRIFFAVTQNSGIALATGSDSRIEIMSMGVRC